MGYELLADKVLVTAINDYRKAKKAGNKKETLEIRSFLSNGYYGINGEILLALADM